MSITEAEFVAMLQRTTGAKVVDTPIATKRKATGKPRKATKKKGSVDRADDFAKLLALIGSDLPAATREARFHEVRRWRFDFAWPEHRIALEVDGGQFAVNGGRHNTDGDREKMNAAAAYGWRVLRFSTQQIDRDPAGCVEVLRQTFAWRG